MFDLEYYNQLAKNEKFHDEFKGNVFSRQNIHRLYNGRCNNNHVWDTLINDLPNDDPLKNTVKLIYGKNGENGLVHLGKKLNEIYS
jgi:hypothetical protein